MRGLILAGTAIAASLIATEVHAQTAQAARETGGLEEIIVTARRVEENQQRVPLAITTITPEMLERAEIKNPQDLPKLVPGLRVESGAFGGPGNPNFSVRGLGASILAEPAVNVYFDEVAVDTRFYPYSFYDLSNIQVLKGPQGTLFGKNSTGGSVLFTSQHPTDRFEGYVEGQIGNYDLRQLTGAINVPLTSWAKFRISGQRQTRDGTLRSVTGGPRYNDRDNWSVKAQLTLNLGDNIETYTQYVHNAVHQQSTPFTLIGVFPGPCSLATLQAGALACALLPPFYNAAAPQTNPGGPWYNIASELALQQSLGPNQTIVNRDMPFRVNLDAILNTTTLRFGDISVKNIARYEDGRFLGSFESDGTRNYNQENTNFLNKKTLSEELQVQGDTGPVQWIVGGYYSRVKSREFYQTWNFATPLNPDALNEVFITETYTSKALFAQATLDMGAFGLEGLKATAGYRYTWDSKDYTKARFMAITLGGPINVCQQRTYSLNPVPTFGAFFPGVDPTTCILSQSANFKESGYNLSLSYQITDRIMTYVTTRKGYKAGGFNFIARDPDKLLYQPEIATDWEAGFKGDFDIGGVQMRANLAAFRTDFKAIQAGVVLIDASGAQQVILNTSANGKPNKAIIKGYEAEVTVIPVKGFEISGFYGRVKGTYKNYANVNVGDLAGEPVAGLTPKQLGVTMSVSPAVPEAWGRPTFSWSYSYRAPATRNRASAANAVLPDPRKFVDLSFAWNDLGGSPIDARVFVTNVFNEQPSLGGNNFVAVSSISDIRVEPRTYGFSLKYRFGG